MTEREQDRYGIPPKFIDLKGKEWEVLDSRMPRVSNLYQYFRVIFRTDAEGNTIEQDIKSEDFIRQTLIEVAKHGKRHKIS